MTVALTSVARAGLLKPVPSYGAVLLADEIKQAPLFFEVHGISPGDKCWDTPLCCSGYPAPSHLLHYSVGAASSHADGRFLGDDSNLVKHDAHVAVGQSGGPLYVPDGNGRFRVVDIQSSTVPDANWAVRLTTDMENLFRQWHEENQADRRTIKADRDLIA